MIPQGKNLGMNSKRALPVEATPLEANWKNRSKSVYTSYSTSSLRLVIKVSSMSHNDLDVTAIPFLVFFLQVFRILYLDEVFL